MATGEMYSTKVKIGEKIVTIDYDKKKEIYSYKGDIPTISKLWNNSGSEYIDKFEATYNMLLKPGEKQPKIVYDGKNLNIYNVDNENMLNYHVKELKENFKDVYDKSDDIRIWIKNSKTYKIEKTSLEEIAKKRNLTEVLEKYKIEDLINKVVNETKKNKQIRF